MKVKNPLLVFASALLPGLLALLGGLHAPQAQAKQCVFNKGGYVLHVHWFRRDDISVNQTSSDNSLGWVKALRPPVQTAALTAGFGDCTKTDEVLVAVTSVIGLELYSPKPGARASNASRLPLFNRGTHMHTHYETGRDYVYKPVASVTCVVDFSGYCRASGVTSEFSQPGVHLLITEPSTSQYLDFAGSIFDVHWVPGGPIR